MSLEAVAAHERFAADTALVVLDAVVFLEVIGEVSAVCEPLLAQRADVRLLLTVCTHVLVQLRLAHKCLVAYPTAADQQLHSILRHR